MSASELKPLAMSQSPERSFSITNTRPPPCAGSAPMAKVVAWLVALPVAVLLIFSTPTASAAPGCPDSGLLTRGAILTNLCWKCFFPIRMAGVTIGGGARSIPGDVSGAICTCPSRIPPHFPTPGPSLGYWLPTHIVESTRLPFCLPSLGVQVSPTGIFGLQTGGQGHLGDRDSYRHFHLYAFPAAEIVSAVFDTVCAKGASFDFDLLFMSEFDPTHNNGPLSLALSPESVLFSLPPATAACLADSVAASAFKPIRQLYWCAGSYGGVYPLTGHTRGESPVNDMSLVTTRNLALGHKRFMLKREYGKAAICRSTPSFFLPKQQYKTAVMYPIPQLLGNDWIGKTTMLSREWRHIPAIGEDWVQALWTYQECCLNP